MKANAVTEQNLKNILRSQYKSKMQMKLLAVKESSYLEYRNATESCYPH